MIKVACWHLLEMVILLEFLALSTETARNHPGAALGASVSLEVPAIKARSSMETFAITVLNV